MQIVMGIFKEVRSASTQMFIQDATTFYTCKLKRHLKSDIKESQSLRTTLICNTTWQ